MKIYRASLVLAALVVAPLGISEGAFAAPTEAAEFAEVQHLLHQGRELSAEEAAELEAQLVQAPEDSAARTRLLGYFFRDRSEAGRRAQAEHGLWFIRHDPGGQVAGTYAHRHQPLDASAYDRAEAWLEQVELRANDPRVLGNAAAFLVHSDRDRAEALLQRAKELDPANPAWPAALGGLYTLKGMSREADDAKTEAAAKSLEQHEEALAGADPEGRRTGLVLAAKAAFDAGELDKAEAFARELVDEAELDAGRWNYGNSVHHGHLILGRLALRDGEVEMAKDHLIAAGETPGSPQLNSFGPNMMLAQELLEVGETEAVLEYFELCGKFWSGSRGRLEVWSETVREGGIPDFQANLVF